jgi:L-malate glycosyltransferase
VSRLLFISTAEGLSWGGSEVLWARVAHELLGMGHHVAFSYAYFPEEPEPLRELRSAGAVGYFRGNPGETTIGRRFARYAALRKSRSGYAAFTVNHWLLSLVILDRPDLVVLNGCNAYGLSEFALPCRQLKEQRIPYAIMCHLENEAFLLSNEKRQKLIDVFGGAKEVSFGSKFGADVVSRQLAARFQQVEVFDNPPNCSGGIQPWPAENPDTFRMACVGRLDVTAKGQDILLAALAEPVWKSREWQLTFYGKGGEEAYLRQLAHMYEIDKRTKFAGFVPDIDEVWSREHLCLQPSPKEGTPMTVVEAMSAGRPCLVTDIGRMPDLIEEGKTGWVCSRGVASVAAALERAWAKRSDWEAMGKAAHEKVKQVWRRDYPRQMAERFLGLVSESV